MEHYIHELYLLLGVCLIVFIALIIQYYVMRRNMYKRVLKDVVYNKINFEVIEDENNTIKIGANLQINNKVKGNFRLFDWVFDEELLQPVFLGDNHLLSIYNSQNRKYKLATNKQIYEFMAVQTLLHNRHLVCLKNQLKHLQIVLLFCLKDSRFFHDYETNFFEDKWRELEKQITDDEIIQINFIEDELEEKIVKFVKVRFDERLWHFVNDFIEDMR